MGGGTEQMAGALETTTWQLEGVTLLVVRGELDIATAPELCREIESASEDRPRIAIDLRDAVLRDTTGVRALIGAAREAAVRMCQLVFVVEPQSGPSRQLDVSGARELVPVTSSVRSAMAAFG